MPKRETMKLGDRKFILPPKTGHSRTILAQNSDIKPKKRFTTKQKERTIEGIYYQQNNTRTFTPRKQ